MVEAWAPWLGQCAGPAYVVSLSPMALTLRPDGLTL